MSSFVYNHAIKEMGNGALNMDTDTLKVMLVNSTYTPNQDDDFVDAGGASDPKDAEIVATNYTGGWGGSGRKTVAVTVTEQDANNRVVFVFPASLTWTALGGAANDTVVGAILIKEGGADDTDSLLIAYWDVIDLTTTGVDYVLSFDTTNGNVRATSTPS